jgi:hypothetical protein
MRPTLAFSTGLLFTSDLEYQQPDTAREGPALMIKEPRSYAEIDRKAMLPCF